MTAQAEMFTATAPPANRQNARVLRYMEANGATRRRYALAVHVRMTVTGCDPRDRAIESVLPGKDERTPASPCPSSTTYGG